MIISSVFRQLIFGVVTYVEVGNVGTLAVDKCSDAASRTKIGEIYVERLLNATAHRLEEMPSLRSSKHDDALA